MVQISLLVNGILTLTCLFQLGNSEYNEELIDFGKLLGKEILIVEKLRTYIQREKQGLSTFNSNSSEYYRRALGELAQTIEFHLSNTIKTNLLTNGLWTEWEKTQMAIEDEEYQSRIFESERVKAISNLLCKGEISLTKDITKSLKCRYVDHGVPFLKIGPFKEEEAYLVPRIVIFHDVIHDKEIETFKRLAKPKLEKARVASEIEFSDDRISEVAWLGAFDHKDVRTLAHRIEHMTRLTMESAENFQIAHYGIGGFYSFHVDFFMEKDMDRSPLNIIGNRIATVLYYMNDVEQGGQTVFPRLNVTVTPQKGSAAFWYNLKSDGEGDYSTYHAACPVISGTKWGILKIENIEKTLSSSEI